MNCWLEITDTDGNPRTLAITLPEMPVDEKAAFVEHVCGVLLDSRFGPQVRHPWFESDIYLDLSLDVNEWPDYMFDFMPTSAIPERLIEETRREMYRELSTHVRSTEVQADSSSENVEAVMFSSPTTLGRGSPSVTALPFEREECQRMSGR